MPYYIMASEKSETGVMRLQDLFSNNKNEVTLHCEGVGESETSNGFECYYMFTPEYPVLVYKNNRVGQVLEENLMILQGNLFDITIERVKNTGKKSTGFVYNVLEIKKTGETAVKEKQVKITGF